MEKPKRVFQGNDLSKMDTSQLIDIVHKFDEVEDTWSELEERYPIFQIDQNQEVIEKLQTEVNEIKKRLEKIDSFWNIANKLDMILDRLSKQGKRHKV